ncbi:MAG: response regulator [Chloroflexota bacterium]|nr:response regulator [Chloroflexota bacterium]
MSAPETGDEMASVDAAEVTQETKPLVSILLLDDVPDLQSVLKEVLEVIGYAVIVADDGQHGIAVLNAAASLPDIIICDMDMPRMDGIVFLKTVRDHPAWASIFFIMMSGRQEDRKPALEQGADDYISKPFNMVELKAVLNKYHAARTQPRHE